MLKKLIWLAVIGVGIYVLRDSIGYLIGGVVIIFGFGYLVRNIFRDTTRDIRNIPNDLARQRAQDMARTRSAQDEARYRQALARDVANDLRRRRR